MLNKLIESLPGKDKPKPDRRKHRIRNQRQDQTGMEKAAPGFRCSPLAMEMPSRTMPTFSLAHLRDNNDHGPLQLSTRVKPAVIEPKISLPTLPTISPQVPLQATTISAIDSLMPQPPPQAPSDPTSSVFVSLEKELLSLLDEEELSKLMPLLSRRGSVARDVPSGPSSLQPIPSTPDIARLFADNPLGNPIA